MVQNDERSYGASVSKIMSLFDAGTFVELGAYTKRYASEEAYEGVVCGYGAVEGKLTFAFLQDSERTKGAFGDRQAKKIIETYALAVKNGAPIIGMFDSAGAVVYDGAQALAAYGKLMKTVSDASGIIPQIAIIDGVCGGSSAVIASMFDFVVTVSAKSKLYVNSPFIVGSEVGTAEYTAASGISAYCADNEDGALSYVKSLITVLPSNNADQAYIETADDLNRVISEKADGYDSLELVKELSDAGCFVRAFEKYTDNMIFGFGVFGGIVAGVVASNRAKKGILDIRSARAAAKLVSFCDAFGIPTVTLVDSEGLEVSAEAEANAYASELAKLAYAYATSENAKVSVVLGNAYGAGFTLLGSKALGADMAYALDGACISVLSPEASVAFVWNSKVGVDSKTREDVEKEWKEKCASAAEAANAGEIDDVIEMSDLRKRICSALQMLSAKACGKPTRRHANMPL